MKTPLHGGCLCGGVRYQLREAPVHLNNCHCLDCRRASAAPFVTWGSVRRDHLDVTSGELRRIAHANRWRSFAACCGTPLFFQETPDTAWIDVTIASLDHPKSFAPRIEIWTEDRLPWVLLDPGRPAFRRSSRETD